MAEHRVRKNNIIYIIPNDDFFLKWKNDEAFIDDYGRLMNRKPNRVLCELKHYAENRPVVRQRTVMPPAAPVKRSSQVKEHLKDTARDAAMEAGGVFIDWAFDKFFYEVLPNVWQEHIVPFFHRPKASPCFGRIEGGCHLCKRWDECTRGGKANYCKDDKGRGGCRKTKSLVSLAQYAL